MKTTLNNAKEGAVLRVVKLPDGWKARQKLNALSIELGSVIKVVRKAILGGAIIIEIGPTEVAIGRGLSEKLLVEPYKS